MAAEGGSQTGYGCLLLAALAVFYLGSKGGSGSDAKAVPAPPLLNAAQRADCTKALAEVAETGAIRARPSKTRIDVEDHLWAAMPADLKGTILGAVSCEVLGRWKPLDISEGPVVAYGYRSGKRLAMLTSVGVSFE